MEKCPLDLLGYLLCSQVNNYLSVDDVFNTTNTAWGFTYGSLFFVETPGRIYGVGIPKECQGHTPAPEVFRREKVEHRIDGSIMKSKTILPKTPGHLHFI